MKTSDDKPFAVFDIDGTLYRWQLYHELVQELTMADVFPDNTYRLIDTAWNDWRGGNLSFHDYEQLVVQTLQQYLPLVPLTVFDAACQKVVSQSSHKVHHFPKQLIDELKAAGYRLIAISGSQQEILEPFCARYGFDIVIGAEYERDGGRFNGEMKRSTMGHKAEILGQLIKQHGWSRTGSLAIGDSDGDADLLEMVERPIAFNPSEGLFERAKRDGWPIVIERKNIAYHLEKQGDSLVLAKTTIH